MKWKDWWNCKISAIRRRNEFCREMRSRQEIPSNDSHVEMSCELIVDAFVLPREYKYRIRGDDRIDWIYSGVAGAMSDCLENEILHLLVEKELRRSLSIEEAQKVETVNDLADLLRRG